MDFPSQLRNSFTNGRRCEKKADDNGLVISAFSGHGIHASIRRTTRLCRSFRRQAAFGCEIVTSGVFLFFADQSTTTYFPWTDEKPAEVFTSAPFFTAKNIGQRLRTYTLLSRTQKGIFVLVFHRILDFKTGPDFHPALFLFQVFLRCSFPVFFAWPG
jgi:hypothetical protein